MDAQVVEKNDKFRDSGDEEPGFRSEDSERALSILLEMAERWSLEHALKENPHITREEVEALRAWSLENNLIPDASDYQLVAFLHSCLGDNERVKSAVRVYHTIRNSAPEVFSNRSFKSENVQKALSLGYVCILPNKTPEGYRIIMQSLRNPDPTDFVYADCCKSHFLAIDSCIRADPTAKGYIFLNNMKGATMSHMWKWGFRLPRKIFAYLQEGMPMRMQRIHFINATPLVDRVMKMLRPLIRKEALEMIHFHTENDMESFFSMVPRDCVPEDFGGLLPSVETLQGETDWFLERMEDFVS